MNEIHGRGLNEGGREVFRSPGTGIVQSGPAPRASRGGPPARGRWDAPCPPAHPGDIDVTAPAP